MLSADELRLAIDIQSRSYALLRWVAEAVGKGFIPEPRAHEYADASESAYEWLKRHYLNLPSDARPHESHLQEFALFFSTYVGTSFDIIAEPGTRLKSRCGCFCPWCTHIENAPHLKPKKLGSRDKQRATTLMEDRARALAIEEGITVSDCSIVEIVNDEATRPSCGYSAYGYWLIKRLHGQSDGPAILALWRQIAWSSKGSPIRGFRLRFEDFVDAEKSLIETFRNKSSH